MGLCRTDVELQLSRLRKDARTVVLTHDFPDPDALASAAGMCRLLQVTRRHEVCVGYGGFVGRAENRVLVSQIEFPVVHVDDLYLDGFDYVGLVDSQPGVGNNALPCDRRPDIVVDHHPVALDAPGDTWFHVCPSYGACATIVHGYLKTMGVPISRRLATAFFYAIKTETQDLVREASPEDVEVFRSLLPQVDREALGAILSPPVQPDYYRLLSRAVERSRIFGSLLLVDLQNVPFPEMVAEIADLMLRHEGVRWVLSIGQFSDALYLSMRTRDPDGNAGTLLREIVGREGRAGGHGTMAGGRIPVADIAAVRSGVQTLTTRLLAALNLESEVERHI